MPTPLLLTAIFGGFHLLSDAAPCVTSEEGARWRLWVSPEAGVLQAAEVYSVSIMSLCWWEADKSAEQSRIIFAGMDESQNDDWWCLFEARISAALHCCCLGGGVDCRCR